MLLYILTNVFSRKLDDCYKIGDYGMIDGNRIGVMPVMKSGPRSVRLLINYFYPPINILISSSSSIINCF